MIFHFPPVKIDNADHTFLSAEGTVFAKLKVESKTEKRTVFLTEHTLIFVLEGVKLLHFAEKTIRVEKGNVVLLKKGVYVMAEYIEEGLKFEALLVFLPTRIIRDVMAGYGRAKSLPASGASYLIFPSNEHIDNFKTQLRRYFNAAVLKDRHLLQLKQREILLLLLKTIASGELSAFMLALSVSEAEDITYIVENHLLQALSIEDYASLSNRSLTSFKREFRKIFNASPRQWINDKRLEHACLLLNNSTDRIADISDACGFESPSYFISLFKKKYGYTPLAFRSKLAIN